MLLSRFADETDLSDWYFIWFLRFGSFCFYQFVYFCKKSENYKQFVSKEVVFNSICHRFRKCLFRRYCTIKISVIWSIAKNKIKDQSGIFSS